LGQGRRLSEARLVLSTVKALRLAKRLYSYRELSRATGVPAPLLSRYVAGRSLPSPETAARILGALERLADPRRALAQRIAETGGIIDTSVVLTEPLYLLLATLMFARRYQGLGATRVLVPEASGIPLAASLSLELETPFTVARRAAAPGAPGAGGGWLCSGGSPAFCVPRGVLGRSDRVVIVDDIVETGRTLRALRTLAEEAGAQVVAVAALVVVGEKWATVSGLPRVDALINLTKPASRFPGF